ncbi:MAG: 2-phospho-L-lactate transferase [Candidatus Dadabacteria bacterium]|nr:2-phospho-L-lactate transferase [Candidatus Dadabacteria bacterium]
MITALGGGVGAAKFLEGLSAVIGSEPLNAVVNTGDDVTIHGLRVSPDVDTVIYRLSGHVDRQRGWGLRDDTFGCLSALSRLGGETWFNIGDSDFATHIYRTHLRASGVTATETASRIAAAFGLPPNINVLPMTDDDVETWIRTPEGEMHFQEYLVKKKMKPEVKGVVFRNIQNAVPAPAVLGAIGEARGIIICPSNPIISIGPILGLRGVRDAIRESGARKIAISPLVGDMPLKGPADRLMRGLGLRVTSVQVAELYRDFLDVMIIDSRDAHEAGEIKSLGIEPVVTDILMPGRERAAALASTVTSLL